MQIFIFCINPTFPSLLLSTHPSLIHTVLMSLCALPHFPYYPFLHTPPPPLLHSSLISPSSCPWKTPRQSCPGSRGTQMPTASGLWLSLLCQVCQVCVCGVTGKPTPCWLRPSAGTGVSMVPETGSLVSLPLHAAITLANGSS